MPPVTEVQSPNRRLDSWKEIAAFFDRDERTVKRWEKERSLPIHRLPGGSRARVFAFTDELHRWMHSLDSAAREAISPEAQSAADSPDPSETLSWTPPVESSSPALVSGSRFPGRRLLFMACTLLLAMAAVGALAYRHRSTRSAGVALTAKNTPPPSHNAEAEELYLKGRYYWNKRTPADLNKAVDYFTQAIVRDPNYAQAYVGLADCYNLLREFAGMPQEEAFPRALAAARKAVELDDSSAEAHASLAFVLFYWKWDFPTAEREFRRAIQLKPDYATAHHWYATSLLSLGRYDESLREIERAQELDPSSTPILADKALILFHDGRADEAFALLKQIEVSQPSFPSTHRYLSYFYMGQRDYPHYLAEELRASALAHDEAELAVARAAEQGFKSRGERGLLENTLEMQKKLYARGQMSPFLVAVSAGRLHRDKEAMQYIQIAYQRHDPYFIAVRNNDALIDLRQEPAFRNLLAQAGFAPVS